MSTYPPLPPHDHAFADLEGDYPDILVWREAKMRAYADATCELREQWQSIETAPRDGSLALLCTDGGIVFVGKLNKHLQMWVDDQGRERFRTVTHWKPLPPPPKG